MNLSSNNIVDGLVVSFVQGRTDSGNRWMVRVEGSTDLYPMTLRALTVFNESSNESLKSEESSEESQDTDEGDGDVSEEELFSKVFDQWVFLQT